MRIVSIAGVRPNFVKIAPIARALAAREGMEHVIVHTGQHYDDEMSGSFIRVLDIPPPDINLSIGSAKHGTQMGRVMLAIEPELIALNPDWVLVYGDDNSTAAAALTAAKLGYNIAHVEAGLRSGVREAPDEINRHTTDDVSRLLFATEPSAVANLRREGVSEDRIRLVGNVMIDSVVHLRPRAEQGRAWEHFDLAPREYIVVTLHYPVNVDNASTLEEITLCLHKVSERIPVVFPVHPRTRSQLRRLDLWDGLAGNDRIVLTEPLDYLTFLSLQIGAAAVVTDSGGVQEESTFLGVPCLTVRPTTERPITVEIGTNELVEAACPQFREILERALDGGWKEGRIPELWDGRAAERIVQELIRR